MHLVSPPPSHTQEKKCIIIIFDFACRLILGDLGAGKGKSSWLSTQEKWNQWINDNAKFEEGGGGGGEQGALIMAMLKW